MVDNTALVNIIQHLYRNGENIALDNNILHSHLTMEEPQGLG